MLAPPETRHYLLHAELRIVRRDYVVFMPPRLVLVTPARSLACLAASRAQYVIVGEKQT
jgi:hypothetical protein